MKKFLCVMMTLLVFLGGYTLVPKKYNLLPNYSVSAARNYAGAYRCRSGICITYTGDGIGAFMEMYYHNQGDIVVLDRNGFASDNPNIDLTWYVKCGTLQPLYR